MYKRWFVVILTALMVLAAGCGDEESEQFPWREDFSDPGSGWRAESDASAEVSYHDGVMRILVQAPNRLAWASSGREYADFHLTVEATQADGPDDNEYGVLVRMQDDDHFYRFSISGDGFYQVARYDGGAWEPLSGDWTPSEAIKQGQATNRIEVIARDVEMTFRVNDEELVQVEDDGYRRGYVGLYAGAFFEPGVEIHFDDLSVTQP